MPEHSVIEYVGSIWADPYWRWHTVALIVFWVAVDVISYASLRFLRKQPDFAHKREMIWGALWWPMIFAAIVVATALLWYAIIRLTGRFSLLAFVIPWTALLLLLQRGIGSWTMQGPGAIWSLWEARRKRERVDLQRLLDQWEERRRRQLRWKGVILAFCALPWAFFTGTWLLSLFLD